MPEVARGQERPGGIAHHDDSNLGDRAEIPRSYVEAEQHRHAEQAEHQAKQTAPVEAVPMPRQGRQQQPPSAARTATSSPVKELGRRRSALERNHQGMASSATV